ncbi:hypothetical protein ABZT03_43390 [Streptomyces sp. NPDC005574]|uniref:WD40 repeat domain-containing protein n=1 Tax=Streptomyces sp. NPDC005574 TaxID=3156891 RepID=UPI0033B99876
MIVHTAVFLNALLATVPLAAGAGMRWDVAHPYVKRHAAAHAVDVGAEALSRLVEDPQFLVYAEPGHLVSQLPHVTGNVAIRHAHVYRGTTAYHRGNQTAAARRDFLALDAAARHDLPLAEALSGLFFDHQPAFAVPRWATTRSTAAARLHTLRGHGGNIRSLATDTLPNGQGVVVAGDHGGDLIVWSLVTGESQRSLSTGVGPISAVASVQSPDGHIVVAASDSGYVVFWNPVGESAVTVPSRTEHLLRTTFCGGAFCDNQRWFMRNSSDAEKRPPCRSCPSPHIVKFHEAWPGHTGAVKCAATGVLPGGQLIAVTVGSDNRTVLWDATTGEQLNVLEDRSFSSVDVASSPDGRRVVAFLRHEKQVIEWDLLAGTQRLALTCYSSRSREDTPQTGPNVAYLFEDTDADAAVATEGNSAVVWDLANGERRHTLVHPRGSTVDAVALDRLSDGQAVAVTAGSTGRVLMWNLDTGHEYVMPSGLLTGQVHAIVTGRLPDGQTVAVTADSQHQVIVRQLEFGGVRLVSPGHFNTVNALAAGTLSNGRTVTVSVGRDGRAIVRDAATGTPLHTLARPHTTSIHAVSLTTLGDGQDIAVTAAGDARVVLWDVAAGRYLRTLPYMGVVKLASSGTQESGTGRGLLITGGADGRVAAWDLTTDRPLHVSPTAPAPVTAVATAVLPSGQTVIAAAHRDGGITIRDLPTGQHLSTLAHSRNGSILATGLSAEGHSLLVAGGADERLLTWDLSTGRLLHTVPIGRIAALATATLPHGQTAAVIADLDGRITVHDLLTGSRLCAPFQLPTPTGAIATTDDGLALSYGPGMAFLRWAAPAVHHNRQDAFAE